MNSPTSCAVLKVRAVETNDLGNISFQQKKVAFLFCKGGCSSGMSLGVTWTKSVYRRALFFRLLLVYSLLTNCSF